MAASYLNANGNALQLYLGFLSCFLLNVFRNEKLEAEAKAGLERFEEITKKWEQANTRDLPMELHDLLKQQKSLSEAMIDEKNKLINDFQMVRFIKKRNRSGVLFLESTGNLYIY